MTWYTRREVLVASGMGTLAAPAISRTIQTSTSKNTENNPKSNTKANTIVINATKDARSVRIAFYQLEAGSPRKEPDFVEAFDLKSRSRSPHEFRSGKRFDLSKGQYRLEVKLPNQDESLEPISRKYSVPETGFPEYSTILVRVETGPNVVLKEREI